MPFPRGACCSFSKELAVLFSLISSIPRWPTWIVTAKYIWQWSKLHLGRDSPKVSSPWDIARVVVGVHFDSLSCVCYTTGLFVYSVGHLALYFVIIFTCFKLCIVYEYEKYNSNMLDCPNQCNNSVFCCEYLLICYVGEVLDVDNCIYSVK